MRKITLLTAAFMAAVLVSGTTSTAFAEPAESTVLTDSIVGDPGEEGEAGELYVNPQQSDINICRIDAVATLPENFKYLTGNAIICQFTDGTNTYEIDMIPENGYSGHGYVPAGSYEVTLIQVYDNASDAEFTQLTGEDANFTVNGTDSHTIDCKLSNYDAIKAEIEALINNIGTDTTTNSPEQIESQSVDETDVSISNETLPWREVGGTDASSFLSYDGTSNDSYNIAIRITHGGSLGEALFRISFDGGETYGNKEYKTASDFPLLQEKDADGIQKDTGLVLHFKNNTYTIDSIYTIETEHEWPVIHVGTGLGTVYVGGELSVPANIVVRIVENGKPGTGTFQLSGDGGENWLDEMLIPEEGEYDRSGIAIKFSNAEYISGDTYSATVEAVQKPDYTYAVVAGIVIVLIIVLMIVIVFLSRKRRKTDSYIIYK